MLELEDTLRCVALLEARLCSPELTTTNLRWNTIWKSFKLLDIIRDGQNAVAQAAETLLHQAESREFILEERVKGQLHEIIVNKDKERSRHFHLALLWRRHAIWTHLHRQPFDIQGALDLVHRYLISPADVDADAVDETAFITSQTPDEQALVRELASSFREALRSLFKWLHARPEVLAALKYKYARIGKGKTAITEETEVWCKHFHSILLEKEPQELLALLIRATANWLGAYRTRVHLVLQVTMGLGKLAGGSRARVYEARPAAIAESTVDGRIVSSKRARTSSPRRTMLSGTGQKRAQATEVTVAEGLVLPGGQPLASQSEVASNKRRVPTMDRGTSPMKAAIGRIEPATKQPSTVCAAADHDMSLSGSEYKTASQQNLQAPRAAEQPVVHTSQETPPSPVSLQDSPAPPVAQHPLANASADQKAQASSQPTSKPASSLTMRTLSLLPFSNTETSLERQREHNGRATTHDYLSPSVFASSAAPPNPTPAFLKLDAANSGGSSQNDVFSSEQLAETQRGAIALPVMPSPHKQLVEAAVKEARQKRAKEDPLPRSSFGGLVFPASSAQQPAVSSSPVVPMRRSSSSAMSFADIERVSPERKRPAREDRQLDGIQAFLEEDAAW